MTDMFRNTKPTSAFLSRLRVFLFRWVHMEIHRLVEVEGKKGADVRNQAGSQGVRSLRTIAKAEVDGVVEAEDDVAHGQEPKIRGATRSVHHFVGVSFDKLVSVFRVVLVLVFSLSLP